MAKNNVLQMGDRRPPQYRIFDSSEFVPRDQMRLNPERELDPLSYTELQNIKRGVVYRHVVADTPQNRDAINAKTAYFQVVAHMEGWKFKPELYQVRYVPKEELDEGELSRVYTFEGESNPQFEREMGGELSEENQVGFQSFDGGKHFRRMDNERADGLERKFRKLF